MTFHAVFTIHCPSCSESYPVDSGKIPAGGIRARCGSCSDVFLVESAGVRIRNVPDLPEQRERPSGTLRPAQPDAPDSSERAARLARVLVSDMVSYHRRRYEHASERGTQAEDFAEEISRSWAEYVKRVGRELALETRYFQDALNETLAGGAEIY